jgi:hypothetical protein
VGDDQEYIDGVIVREWGQNCLEQREREPVER